MVNINLEHSLLGENKMLHYAPIYYEPEKTLKEYVEFCLKHKKKSDLQDIMDELDEAKLLVWQALNELEKKK